MRSEGIALTEQQVSDCRKIPVALIDLGIRLSSLSPRETQTCDSEEHNCDAYQSQPMSRFPEQHHANQSGPDRADSGPNRICSAYRYALDRYAQKIEAGDPRPIHYPGCE